MSALATPATADPATRGIWHLGGSVSSDCNEAGDVSAESTKMTTTDPTRRSAR
jgi:hypothetical protein